ncbi:Asp23/Gls24 family envelope stress response protein [Paenisporosarcina sp. TG20]|uniref:Asp23/Gls24 family envelope stress response protein n=1 Tax=Paenisporosarcina sp. TG20 TaxID=1211706 RepID=UPI000301DBCC|nr:Asp23/Gls24 family envelope stress response protein [Paenisporosarcina sp. TG20]
MTDKTVTAYLQITPLGKEELGKIEIAPEVLEVIAGIATTDVEGVGATRGSFASGVAERLGKKVHGKGIKTELTERGLFVEIYCTVKYGASIPKVAKEVQNQVRQAILNMTSLETQEVNVHITGVQFEAQKETIIE